MAVQFTSVQTQNNLGGDVAAITIAKPTSLAVGDMMVAHIAYQREATLTPHSGWKNLAGTVDLATTVDDGQSLKVSVQWKVADASDVAASNFTWDVTVDTSVRMAGAIYRIIGQNLTTPIGASNQTNTSNSATPSFAIGITPAIANSLLLFLATSSTEGSAHTGQAVATNNPSWSEKYDMTAAGSNVVSGTVATRPETTSTGNARFTVTTGTATTDSTCFLISISPEPDPVLTPSAIAVTVNVPVQTLAVPYSKTLDTITITVNATGGTESKTDKPVTNETKPTVSSVTNEPKI